MKRIAAHKLLLCERALRSRFPCGKRVRCSGESPDELDATAFFCRRLASVKSEFWPGRLPTVAAFTFRIFATSRSIYPAPPSGEARQAAPGVDGDDRRTGGKLGAPDWGTVGFARFS